MFKEVDDIVRLGKWAFLQIPVYGNRCKGCLLLRHNKEKGSPYCDLASAYGLLHDNEGAFRSDNCPVKGK